MLRRSHLGCAAGRRGTITGRRTSARSPWRRATASCLIDPIDPPARLRRPTTCSSPSTGTGAARASSARSTSGRRRARTQPLKRGIEVTDPFRAGDELPGGIQRLSDRARRRGRLLAARPACGRRRRRAARRRREAAPYGRTAAPLSRALARARRHTRSCAETLRPLLDLPVERVLVSHGIPILGGGKHALAAVVGVTRLARLLI